jgi:hypothetical protein
LADDARNRVRKLLTHVNRDHEVGDRLREALAEQCLPNPPTRVGNVETRAHRALVARQARARFG